MENRPFGKTGHDVSALGFGGAEVGYLETEQRQVAQVLNTLLDEGVNLIDTAAAYAGSEEVIGKAIAHRRDEYVLVSKCGRPFEDLPGEAWSPDLVSATVDRSLRRLQTDRLDVMLLHSCDLEILKKGDALGALVKAREAGKIRFVGYSGDNEAAVHAAGLPDVAVIETSVSICDQANIDGVLPLAARNGIGVLAKRPIANAAWKDVSERRGIYVNYAKTYAARLAAMGLAHADLGFGGDPAEAWPEIALRFTLAQPGVTTAIIGTTSDGHVRRNIAIAGQGPLPEDAMAKIREAFRRAEREAGEAWPGQT